jgi:streptogramin lyase
MLRKLALLAALPASLFFACGGDDGDDSATGGTAGDTGAAGEGGSGATTSGKGTIVVEVTGLPTAVEADVTLDGPEGTEIVTESVTLEDMTIGTYTTFAERVTDSDPIVRTVYDPSVDPVTFRLPSDETETVRVNYEPVPSSSKLWTVNANGDHALAAFASEVLAESGEPDAKVTVDSPAGIDIAFDRGGNLWAMGPTVADPHLVRFSSGVLGTSGEPMRDRAINVLDIPCIPALRAMAFDLDGNLWVSTCGDRVVRLTTADLALDGDVSPEVVFGDVAENGNLAFDASGNLWVATGATVSRYDAERLDASDGEAANLVLTVTNPDDTNELGVTDLVFDAGGNLWVTDFGGNLVYEVAAADLAGTGNRTVAAAVRIAIGVGALIDRPAFDDSGALWFGLGGEGIGRLLPEQLGVSTDAGDPTIPEVVITSADLGSVGRLAFYPAAAGLPLLSSL